MALAAYDIDFYLSGAGSHGGAQADPNASLGAYRSSTKLDELESMFTAVAAVDDLKLVDSARIGDGVDAHVGKWLLIVGGNNAVDYASRITTFDNSSGEFGVFTALPAAVAIGDQYRIFDANNLFDDSSAVEAAAGDVEHRMIYSKNATGIAFTAVRYYLELLEAGSGELEIVADDHAAASDQWQAASVDEEDEPDLSGFWGNAVFERPIIYGGSSQPPGNPGQPNGNGNPIWVRRTLAANTRGMSPTVFKLVLEATNTGGVPDPIRGAALIIFDIAGFTSSLEVTRDRKTYVFGGGRMIATLTAQETGLVVSDEPVTWELTSGPGALNFDGTEETDDDGESSVVYVSPADEAEEGSSVTITAKV
jgi:hypothetical protein